MKSLGAAIVALENELNCESDEYTSFESGSLIRELKKSAHRGDDEITLILARAYCEKHLRQQPHQECLIYCRVSTEQQALENGLFRQLKTCADYARFHDYGIAGIFCEVASGADPLPTRALVQRIAEKRGCLILCEDHSRWSRAGMDDAPPAFVKMTSVCSERLDEVLGGLLANYKQSLIAVHEAKAGCQ